MKVHPVINVLLQNNSLNKSTSIVSNESDAKYLPSQNEENKFIFSFFIMMLKKSGERTKSDIVSELR